MTPSCDAATGAAEGSGAWRTTRPCNASHAERTANASTANGTASLATGMTFPHVTAATDPRRAHTAAHRRVTAAHRPGRTADRPLVTNTPGA